MEFSTQFSPLTLDELTSWSAQMQEDGWRFVQILATKTEAGFDLVYSFMKDGILENRIIAVTKDDKVPSISDKFLAAFVFENEIHDLFGIAIENIAIDFAGKFYALSQAEPMTVISPEQAAAREKAAKIAAAKAAKAAKEKTAENNDDLEAKLAGMDPEKAARVRAAMQAKAAKEKAAQDAAPRASQTEKGGE